MLKYLSKFAMDILPSVAATIIGAYIVNHYITAKPAADTPVAAALSSSGSGTKPAAKASEDVANIPEAGVRAKGISEKAIFEKSSIERAAVEKTAVEKPAEKTAEKPQEKPEDTASISAESRRHPAAPREKTAIRTIPLTAPVATASAVAPASAPAAAPTLEASVAPDEHRDASDLARAAIERLRGGNDGGSHVQETTTRTPDAPRVASAPPASAPAAPQIAAPSVRPLPPPIMVSTPPADTLGTAAAGSAQPTQQASTGSARVDDPRRPTPPADIPGPLDLRAEAMELPPPTPAREHRTVADDMLSAAKSVFHAVLPQ